MQSVKCNTAVDNINVGDLVKFYTDVPIFKHKEKTEYGDRNPGIVIESSCERFNTYSPDKFMILWANNDITVEYISYIRLTSKLPGYPP